MSDSIAMAMAFATGAHGAIGHKRKYTGDAYIVHPTAVAAIVASAGGSIPMVCASLLHDFVEDTQVDLSEIEYMFGEADGQQHRRAIQAAGCGVGLSDCR